MFSPDTPHFLHIVQEMVSERHLLLKRTNKCRGFKEEGKLLKLFSLYCFEGEWAFN